MSASSIIVVALCVALTLIACVAAGAAVWAARAARIQALPDVVAIRGLALEARQDSNAIRGEWQAMLKTLDAAMEALDDQSNTLKRRRARVDMSERRAAQRVETEEEQDPMEAAMRRARAEGLPV